MQHLQKTADFLYKVVWLSMLMIASYYAGQLDTPVGSLTSEIFLGHLYAKFSSFYGGTVFQAFVCLFALMSFGCWIRALRVQDTIDSREIVITIIFALFFLVELFLPDSGEEFWTGNLAYTFMVIDFGVLFFGALYHWTWNLVIRWINSAHTDG